MLEMVVDRCPVEDPAFQELEADDLLDKGRGYLDHKDRSGDDEDDLLTDEDGCRAHHSSEKEASCVTHEDLGRVRVEPEKADRRADNGSAEDGDLSASRDVFI